ncbi:CHASE domain-containing protein [Chromatium okenii]|uniref:CHASE domain-containing protein n=1 Tax=Chromatium okenii TaxID=61644 RepID=A0A2S7XNS3_9GAMM|nr:CHASE domain-containing protein [Chromatium okenii]PQJ95088.1 hypothetical protein CXB77_12275 [Chromatium okenii]
MSNYNNTLSSTALFLLAIGLALAAFFIERVNDHRHAEVIRHSVQDRLEIVESRLESNLISDMQLVKALVAVVAADPNLDQKRFTRAMKTLFEGHSRLKNISAAPDLIIRMMYPIEGNELAIGLDYRTLPNQYPAVALAQRTRKIILNGPIKLIQGGCGFIARIPIYLDTETAKEVFWGLSSTVIHCEKLYKDSGLLDETLELDIAIRARNDGEAWGSVFFGSTEVFETAPVLTEVSLPYGAWQLAAIPHGGWPQHAENLWTLRIILLIVGALVFFPVWGLLRALHRANAAQESLVNALSLTEATLEATITAFW